MLLAMIFPTENNFENLNSEYIMGLFTEMKVQWHFRSFAKFCNEMSYYRVI